MKRCNAMYVFGDECVTPRRILPPRLPASGFPIPFADTMPKHRVYTLCCNMSPLRGSTPMWENPAIRTYQGTFLQDVIIQYVTEATVKGCWLHGEQVLITMQKGADYNVISTLLQFA